MSSTNEHRGTVSSFFSHPFILSVLGAILISAVGANLQNRYALEQLSLSRNQQFRERQIQKLHTFMEPLSRYLLVLYNWKLNKEFLLRADHDDKDYLGRSHEEVKELYAEMRKELWRVERGQAVLTSIRGFYYSEEVNRLLDQIQSQVRSMQETNLSETEIIKLDTEITTNIRSLVVAMQQEVRSSNGLPCS